MINQTKENKMKINQVTRYITEAMDREDRESFISSIKESIKEHQIYDIDGSPEEIVIGWSDAEDNFSTEFNNYIIDNLLTLNLRIDKKKISKSIFKKLVSNRIKEKETDDIKLTPSEISNIKEAIKDQMFSEAKADPKSFGMAWNLDTGIVYLFTTNKEANEEFETLFQKTFNKLLVCQFPYTMAENYISQDKIDSLTACEYKD